MSVRLKEGVWSPQAALVETLALLAALLVLPLVLAPRAEAQEASYPGSIARTNLDGTDVDKGFITWARPTPGTGDQFLDLAVDSGHVYWAWADRRSADSSEYVSAIGRANLDGSGVDPDFISLGPRARFASVGLAVDAGHIYWIVDPVTDAPGTIGRADLDGSGFDPDFMSLDSLATAGLGVDGAQIYWTEGRQYCPGPECAPSIGRANLDGTGVDPDFIVNDYVEASSLAIDPAHLYWTGSTSFVAPVIGRAKLDGTAVESVHVGESAFVHGGGYTDVAVDGAYLYWIWDVDAPGADLPERLIVRANLDGSGADARFLSPAYNDTGATHLAVDAGHLYWTLYDDGVSGAAFAPLTQRAKHGVVRVRVPAPPESPGDLPTPPESLTAKASGKVKINPSYKLRPKKVQVAAGESRTLKLKPKKAKATKRIIRALKRGEKAWAKLTVKLTDQPGYTKTQTLWVRLKR